MRDTCRLWSQGNYLLAITFNQDQSVWEDAVDLDIKILFTGKAFENRHIRVIYIVVGSVASSHGKSEYVIAEFNIFRTQGTDDSTAELWMNFG